MSKEVIERAAKAMALHAGWEKWETATSFADTLGGNDPEDERQYWIGLATIALTQAAANKTAEEGGLPAIPAQWESKAQWIVSGPNLESEERGRLAVMLLRVLLSADRASLQVANKAQHDIWGPNGEFAEFYVAGFEGREICPTTKGNALAAYSNGIKDRVANKAEVDLSSLTKYKYDMPDEDGRYFRVVDVKALLAAPPATTGASTADLESILDRLDDAIGGYSGGPFDKVLAIIDELRSAPDCGACPGDGSMCKSRCKVEEESPANTVLTDERSQEIEHLQTELAAVRDLFPIPESGELHQLWAEACSDPLCVANYVKGHLVAAQAGQVAVPGWISVNEQLPSSDLLPNGDCPSVIGLWKEGALASNLVQQMITNTAYLRNNPQNFTHWMPLPASPAKESK